MITSKSQSIGEGASRVEELKLAISEAETFIVECMKNRDSATAAQASLLDQCKLEAQTKYLKAPLEACRLSIEAWKLSIIAHEEDINMYRSEINEILEQLPEARMDH